MSNPLIEIKRSKLQKEIEVAKFHLASNLEQIEPSEYLPSAKELLPNIASSLMPDLSRLLPQLDSISKNILPNNNLLRSILSILNILK